jgi:hypothetical protein
MPEIQLIRNVAPHSVEINRNASGGVSIAVKCYAESVEGAFDKAATMYAELDAKFPVAAKAK